MTITAIAPATTRTQTTTKATPARRLRAAFASITALSGGPRRPLAAVGSSATMRITNHTAAPAVLANADAGSGWWVQAPPTTLNPGQTYTVIAATHAGEQFVQVNYIAETAEQPEITFALRNAPVGTDQGSTGVAGGALAIRSAVSQQYPDAAARYELA